MPEPMYFCTICDKTFPATILESAERLTMGTGKCNVVIRLRVSGAVHVLKKIRPKKESQ